MESHIEASKMDAVFSMVEDFISEQLQIQQSGEDNKGGRMRNSTGNTKLLSVFTPQWRKAVIHIGQKFPISLMIREFENYYYHRMISTGTSVTDTTKSLAGECHQNDCQAIDLPVEVLVEIFFRLPLHDLLASRSVCCEWDSVYASKQFQGKCTSTEKCIVINNHNLDMWVFSVVSKCWFLLKVPCDWDSLGMRTLGIKASSNGLFLVARSDFTLYVVNPLTTQFKSLPQIYPQTHDRIKFLNSLIVHGTAEMQAMDIPGRYVIHFFGNCPGQGDNYVYLARYMSWTGLWTVKQIYQFHVIGNYSPLHSRSFPSPLWSYSDPQHITCFSATGQYFDYISMNSLVTYFENDYIAVVLYIADTKIPTTIELEYRYGETCYNNVALPTVLPHLSNPNNSEVIVVGRMKRNDNGNQTYGRIPIVCHGDIGLWKFNKHTLQWTIIDIITAVSIENMIKSSEGTDFLVVGDGLDNIWLMLRGSENMVHYNLGTREWLMETGCPGGGYMDAGFHWKAVFDILKFGAKV